MEIEGSFTMEDVEFALLWAVFKAWIGGKSLTIRNPDMKITMTSAALE